MMLHQRPSRERAAGDLEARQFAGVIVECRPTAGKVDETTLLRGSANKSGQSRDIFLTGRVVFFCGDQGTGGEKVEPIEA